MNKKITELTEATEMHDEDLLMIVQNNQNKKIKGININSISIGPTEPKNNTTKEWIRNGKNLFNGKYIENYGYDQSTGNLTPTSAVFCNEDMIELPLGATKVITSKSGISLNTRYFFYDKNRDYMSSLAGINNVSVPEGARYINFQMTMETANNDMSNIQVETEEVTEYEEYVAPGIFVKNDKGQYYNILGLMQMQKSEIGKLTYNNTYFDTPDLADYAIFGKICIISFRARVKATIPNQTQIIDIPYEPAINSEFFVQIGGRYTIEKDAFAYVSTNRKKIIIEPIEADKYLHIKTVYITQ